MARTSHAGQSVEAVHDASSSDRSNASTLSSSCAWSRIASSWVSGPMVVTSVIILVMVGSFGPAWGGLGLACTASWGAVRQEHGDRLVDQTGPAVPARVVRNLLVHQARQHGS